MSLVLLCPNCNKAVGFQEQARATLTGIFVCNECGGKTRSSIALQLVAFLWVFILYMILVFMTGVSILIGFPLMAIILFLQMLFIVRHSLKKA